jgi:scyllo-inositol 2-dehydrogenase (NADP+)
MSPVGVSILGTGSALKGLHFPLLSALPNQYKLVSVLERTDRGVAKEVCGDSIKVVSTLDAVLSDSAVDLVVVATPNTTHYDYIKQALEAGKHGKYCALHRINATSIASWTSTDDTPIVLCEKPLTPTAKEAEELYALAAKQKVILSVFQNRRWESDFKTLVKLVKTGKVCSVAKSTSVEHATDENRSWDPSWTLTAALTVSAP